MKLSVIYDATNPKFLEDVTIDMAERTFTVTQVPEPTSSR